MKKIFFSIIIPVRCENQYLKETLTKLKKQSFKNFEVIVVTDKISHNPNPSYKRNLGAKKSKGEYLCFLDDDSYPHQNWLKNIFQQINKHPDYAAFCGPCLTPAEDNLYQKASGLVWSSFMGSGGAGTYRNRVSSPRFIDDYPSVNLIVKKTAFQSIGGFNTHHWPGEDTILCLDLFTKLHQKIFYHPSILVYHHRRSVLFPHLKQITRYALHRGNFARIYPQNSLKIGYLLPSAFLIYLLTLPLTHFYWPLYLYLFLLFLTLISSFISGFSFPVSVLATITIPLTHLYYAILFIIGFFSRKLDFIPHQTNEKGYIGG